MRVSTIKNSRMEPWWLNFWKTYDPLFGPIQEILEKYQCRMCNPYSPFTSELEFDTEEDYTMFKFIFLCETFND